MDADRLFTSEGFEKTEDENQCVYLSKYYMQITFDKRRKAVEVVQDFNYRSEHGIRLNPGIAKAISKKVEELQW